jgi:hypothetical protein
VDQAPEEQLGVLLYMDPLPRLGRRQGQDLEYDETSTQFDRSRRMGAATLSGTTARAASATSAMIPG